MPEKSPAALHLTSEWFIQPGRKSEVARVSPKLVADVHAAEPDTLVHFVRKPFTFAELLTSAHGFMRAEAGITLPV
jgi:hypothetical protein